MKNSKHQRQNRLSKRFSPAHRIGIIAMVLSLLTAPFSLELAGLPLVLFVALCFAAPFFPGFSFYLPIISRCPSNKQAVAITFDDGPDPSSTPDILNLLAKYRISATFYVNGQRAERYPHLIRKIVSQGHTIGNHTYSHDNFIMLKSADALKIEIQKAQRVLFQLGVIPYTFRPPVGITSPRLNNVLNQLDMYTVNFNRRAGDRGNRQIHRLSKKILKKLRSGDIIMLHDIPLRNEKKKRQWLTEVENILAGIRKEKLSILPLADLIDQPIMENIKPGRKAK
jgi:peptidoglycan/xylan/chitin deacetylase (PgdA/CDA1 family)